MKLKIVNVKDEPDFSGIARLYKKTFPKSERIPTRNFHRYALRNDVFFRSFYDGEKFVGFVKGFLAEKTLYISWFAFTEKAYETAALSAVLSLKKEDNVILVVRKKEDVPRYEKLGFFAVVPCRAFGAGALSFLCSKPALFDEKKTVEGIKRTDWPLMFPNKPQVFVYYAKLSALSKEKLLAAKEKFHAKDDETALSALLREKVLSLHRTEKEFCVSVSVNGDLAAAALSIAPVGAYLQAPCPVPKVLPDALNENDRAFLSENGNDPLCYERMLALKNAGARMKGVPPQEVHINYLFLFGGAFFREYSLAGNVLGVCSTAYRILPIKEVKL